MVRGIASFIANQTGDGCRMVTSTVSKVLTLKLKNGKQSGGKIGPKVLEKNINIS